jgi:AcrR family transcriptional regulator
VEPDSEISVWGSEKPRRRPVLSRDAIVAAALAVADSEGLDAVSIRRVASDLGVRPMSLYTYIDKKEDLLVLMRDQVNGEVLLGADLPDGWRPAITAIARRTREAVLRHPWLVDTAAHTFGFGPNALRHLEESLTALRDLGLSKLRAAEILHAVDKYVHGHAAFEISNHSASTAKLAAQPYAQSLLASGEFPQLAELIAEAVALIGDNPHPQPQHELQFERGLNWLLDGIAAEITGAVRDADERAV